MPKKPTFPKTSEESQGLTTREAQERLKTHGPNEIKGKKQYTLIKIIFSQFTSFLILILIIAGSISIYLKEYLDGIAIFTIVIINALIGVIQEYKAENAIKALKKMVIPETVVIRDGQQKIIKVTELVPRDIVILNEGDKIPADIEIFESYGLKVDEAVLTGESIPVSKSPSKDRKFGLVYKGTIIVNGRGLGKVIATGKNTEFGKIVNLVSAEEDTRSPLTIQLDSLGKKLGIIVLVIITIIFFIGIIKKLSPIKMLMTSVALGVSAIPEGLPLIVTLTLALGVQLLARKNAIIRRMSAIESLGATTVICSDKTGTLTLNEMTTQKINTNFKEKIIAGIGYDTDEKFTTDTEEEKKLLEIANNCNNAFVGKNLIGDPTELALKILAVKGGIIKTHSKLDEITFTSDRKMMSTLHCINKTKEIFVKGAFEEIIKRCTHIQLHGQIRKITKEDIRHYTGIAENYALEALRVLGFAYKIFDRKFTEDNLIFVGLVGIIDPPRETVHHSLALAKKAGIKIKIITGDNALTALAIGRKIGLNAENALTGDQIDQLSDEELKEKIFTTDIFARTRPEHKHRIVDILMEANEVVAVTGDGVNDAPALKHADVGIAMGIKGTEATKEVADIVLKDDNFSTIINTIEEGRRIYKNILAFIKYMLSANMDAITTVAILTIIGLPLPLLPLQILWINIVTDSLPALALGAGKGEKDAMSDPPHPKHENIFKKFTGFIFITIIFQTSATIILYLYGYQIDTQAGLDPENLNITSHARTLVFTEIVIFEMFLAFVCQSEKSFNFKQAFSNKSLVGAVILSTLLQIFVIYTPFMQTIFKTTPLNLTEWGLVILFSLTALLLPWISKLFKKNAL